MIPGISSSGLEVLKNMLKISSQKRSTAAQLLKMPYFKMQELITPTTAYTKQDFTPSNNSPHQNSGGDGSVGNNPRLSSLTHMRHQNLKPQQMTHYEPSSVFSNNFNLGNQNQGLKTQKLNPLQLPFNQMNLKNSYHMNSESAPSFIDQIKLKNSIFKQSGSTQIQGYNHTDINRNNSMNNSSKNEYMVTHDNYQGTGSMVSSYDYNYNKEIYRRNDQ